MSWKIKPYTPHTRMIFRAIVRKIVPDMATLAEVYGMPEDNIDELLTEYGMLCARAEGLNGQLDFKLSTMESTPEEVRKSFDAYVNSQSMALLREVEQAMIKMDSPADRDLAPGAKPEGED